MINVCDDTNISNFHDYHKFQERFDASVKIIKHNKGSLKLDPKILRRKIETISKAADTASTDKMAECKKKSKQKFLACAMLTMADRNRFGKLQKDTL